MAVHSVSDVTKYIKNMFDGEDVLQNIMIRGEISNFKRYTSGHCYFTLKDASASLKCVMFRSRAQTLRFVPENGLKVVAGGSLSVYERDGAYQLYTDSIVPEGAGELSIAFAQLKARLTDEGLFAVEHKKSLPKFPKKIGVITSLSGAVLRDIYHVAKRRNPAVQLILYPVQVQGTESAVQIAEGIRFFNKKYPVDVLIAGRGGGSMEDLWSFNEEVVVRAIYASKIPVVSAVGHETDFTLADFAADVRAATPSQAAEIIVPDAGELTRYMMGLTARLETNMHSAMHEKQNQLVLCLRSTAMHSPQRLFAEKRQRLDMAVERLTAFYRREVLDKRHVLELRLGRLETMSPLRVLRRGYSIVESDKGLVKSVHEIREGEWVHVRLADGSLQAVVKSVEEGGEG
jgi:exodeoxyribonuclease VII large subunit